MSNVVNVPVRYVATDLDPIMQPDPIGAWVHMEDYKAQAERIEELEAELEKAQAQIEEVEEQRNFTQGLVLKLDAMLAKAEAQIEEIEEQRNFTQGLVLKLDAKLAKATEALEGVRSFTRDLGLYAGQGHTLAPALRKACDTLAELKGEQ